MKKMKILVLFISFIASGCFEDIYDLTTLKVIDYHPSNHQYGIQEDVQVFVEFNSDVKREDIEKNFSLSSESGTVEGTFEWVSGKKFNFVPRYELEIGSRYAIEIPRMVEDKSGNKMEMDFLSDFYIGDDLVKPSILSTIPVYTEGGTMNVPVDQNIVVTLSKPMNINLTESLFSLSPDVSGYFSWNAGSTQMTYMLTSQLDYGTQYKLTIPSSVEDISGNTLEDSYTVVFITGDDFAYPLVDGICVDGAIVPPYWDPDNINNDISKFGIFVVYFSESMNIIPTESAFSITPSVDGTFEWNAGTTTMTFSPIDSLDSETIYTIRIATGAEDINGLNLQDEYLVRFKTDADDSQHIRVGDVRGSNDGITWGPPDPLFTTTPAIWPVDIEMGPSLETDYYFNIQFINDNGPVAMEPYSIFDNILVEGFNPDYEPSIYDITWNPGYTEITVILSGLSNDQDLGAGEEPVLYRLTIVGGENGVLDADGNSMTENFIFEFRE